MCGGGPGILHSPQLAGGTHAERSQTTLPKSKTWGWMYQLQREEHSKSQTSQVGFKGASVAKPLSCVGQMALTVWVRSDVLPNSTSTDPRSRESGCLAPLCTLLWGRTVGVTAWLRSQGKFHPRKRLLRFGAWFGEEAERNGALEKPWRPWPLLPMVSKY